MEIINLNSLHLFNFRLKKFFFILRNPFLLRVFFKYGVLCGVEHYSVLNDELETVVDIGANRGQFSLAAYAFTGARIFSFEPLKNPSNVFRAIFLNNSRVIFFECAIGPDIKNSLMHVSARDDSSSLLPISSKQLSIFPGTNEVDLVSVKITTLESCLNSTDIGNPAMLKIDVQGFEFEVLLGCETLLSNFEFIYCECSFMELYSGQKLASTVIDWLSSRGFYLKGIYNPTSNDSGLVIQADFLFSKIAS